MSNIIDVAKKAGVSAMTVSRYFNQPSKVAPSTRKRVEEAITALQYVPNAAARSLVQGKTHTVAAILSDLTNPFFTTLARGIEDTAQRHGYTLFVGNTDESLQKEQHYLDALVSRRVDGVLLSPSPGESHHLERVGRRGIPIVLIDRRLKDVHADVVRGDSYVGARRLVDHFLEQGFRDIAFVGGQPGISSLEDRLSGYRNAMEGAGLDVRVHLGKYDRSSGEQITDMLVEENEVPEAIVAANNLVAVGVLVALRRHALRVPEDVALACFEDLEIAASMDPFLTVAEQPAYEMGCAAMEMLIGRMEGHVGPPQERVFPVDLIVRRSSIRCSSRSA